MVKEVTTFMVFDPTPRNEDSPRPRRGTRPASVMEDDDDDDDDIGSQPRPVKRPPRIRTLATHDPDDPDYQSDEKRKELEALYEESFKDLEEGEIVRGRVLGITANEVLVDVGFKSEGVIPPDDSPISRASRSATRSRCSSSRWRTRTAWSSSPSSAPTSCASGTGSRRRTTPARWSKAA